ncbi:MULTISPECIES: GtrA family protein [Corynebacterium]|nr:MULTISPECIES: GtrA family protein [Corynebacterium]AMJ44916.1 hypothetical protein AW169_08475 [Corynebacterium stationis]AQX71369.1 hypothetical protein CA21670_07670 [Corynebacterium stationis]ASJ19055.1 hypothetical protein BA700_08475 [Corynebacterium stationis]MDN6137647.1 GtrA family protein [Corynebacterium sp.]MDN6737963.1 GtrA family protein [Corynebacterium sp.]
MTVARFISNMGQFLRFGLVGGSGTVVNLLVVFLSKKIAMWSAGITEHDGFMNLFGTQFNIRWYHVFMAIAFLLANTWNYQLNRMWTFKEAQRISWLRGFFPFLLAGLGAFLVSQVIATLLMNVNSPIALSPEIFDDSTGFRTKFYWASAISIIVAMPINFVINKLWTFRSRPKSPVFVQDAAPS